MAGNGCAAAIRMDRKFYHVPRGGISDSSALDLRGHLVADSSFDWKARCITASVGLAAKTKRRAARPALRKPRTNN